MVTISFRSVVWLLGIMLVAAALGLLLACAAALTVTAFQGYGFDGDPVSVFGVVTWMGCAIGFVPWFVVHGIENVLSPIEDLWDKNPSITIGRKKTNLPKARAL